jgi:hypothetical protein
MTYALAFLVALVIVLSTLLWFSVKRNLLYSDKQEELGDQIEESLDIINECYKRISRISGIPAASDDPIIRQLVSDIKYTRESLLLIANKVVSFEQEDDDAQE